MSKHRLGGFSSILMATTALGLVSARAANIAAFTGPTGSNPIQGVPATLPDFNTLVNNINSGVTPNSMAPYGTFRNFLDNGAMAVTQRATATTATSGGATSGCSIALASTSYSADRWCGEMNVASGVAFTKVVTTSTTAPIGFTNTLQVFRNSGSLTTASWCAMQEIPSSDSIQLAGQTVVFSFYALALAGLSADTGNVITGAIFAGTGWDQGLATMGVAGQIAPAWTNVSTATTTATFTLSATNFQRFTSLTANIPTSATEVGVALCGLSSSAGTAGTTDGFAFTGAQLEVGTVASAFEFRPLGVEINKAQRYYFEAAESAGNRIRAVGYAITAVTANMYLPFPVQMRTTPTTGFVTGFSVTGAFSSGAGTLTAVTALSAVASGTSVNGMFFTVTTTGLLSTGGTATFLVDNNATGKIAASADF